MFRQILKRSPTRCDTIPTTEAVQVHSNRYSHADYAGCVRTRRSTHGTVVRLGMHTIKASSGLQPTISLSVGEAEYYGVVKAIAVGMMMQSICKDWDIDFPVKFISENEYIMTG